MPIHSTVGEIQGRPVGILHAWLNLVINQGMTKSLEVISEAVRDSKHPFRKVDSQPKKQQKHRYERRIIREYLQTHDWMSMDAT